VKPKRLETGKSKSFDPPVKLNTGLEILTIPVTLPIMGTLAKPWPDPQRMITGLIKGLGKMGVKLLGAPVDVLRKGGDLDVKGILGTRKETRGGGLTSIVETTLGLTTTIEEIHKVTGRVISFERKPIVDLTFRKNDED